MDKQRIIGAALGMVFLLPFVACAETDEDAIGKEPVQEKSLSQKVMDQYHEWKNHLAVVMGGYSGDTDADRRTYMEHYRNDLSTYLYPYIGMDELFMVDNNKYYLTARALALTAEELEKLLSEGATK